MTTKRVGEDLELVLEGKGRARRVVEVRGPKAGEVNRALGLFRSWAGRDAESVEVAQLPPGSPRVLVRLGDLMGVLYRSDKWGGKARDYIHETDRPRPSLFATPDGRMLVLAGGKIRVRPEGLVG